jgi:signal transduction histidine kinase
MIKGYSLVGKNRSKKNSAFSDFLILFTIATITFIVALIFDIFEPLVDFILNYKSLRLDEIIIVFILLGVTSSLYFLRRRQELRNEIIERENVQSLMKAQNHILEQLARGVPTLMVLEELINFVEEKSGAICAIMLLDVTGTKLSVGLAPHLPQAYLSGLEGNIIGSAVGACGTACFYKKPVYVSDIANDPLWADFREHTLSFDLKASWCAPIYKTNGKVIGTFAMYYKSVKSPTPEYITILESASNIAGIALERQQTEESISRYAKRLENLHEIDLAILAANSSQEIARSALVHLVQMIPSCWAGLITYDFGNSIAKLLEINANRIDLFSLEKEFTFESTTLPEKFYKGEVLAIGDMTLMENHPHLSKLNLPSTLKGFISVPIQYSGNSIGSLNLGTDKLESFTLENIEVLREVADQLAIGLQNLHLFEEIKYSQERLQALSHQLVLAQETERRHIARELHDEIGQALTAIKISLQTAQRISRQAALNLHLDDNIAIVDHAIHQVRTLSLELRPSMLDDLGLIAALRWYLDKVSKRSELVTQFNPVEFEARLSSELETTCFRLVQEAVNNVIKHAYAYRIVVTLELLSPTEFCLIIRDDGIGFDVQIAFARANKGSSLGLLGMQERIARVGGRISIKSSPDAGTEIIAIMPLSLAAKVPELALGGANL